MKLVLTAFLPFALGYFLSFLFRSLNAVVAPALRSELGLDDAAIGVITSTYLAAFALAQLPAGVALDRFGPRRVAPLMLLIAALGAAVFALGHDALTLSIGRALIVLLVHLAVATSMAVAFALITRAFAPELAGRVNTSLNLACMLFAFVVQAAIGPAVAWMETAHGLARAQAHQVVILVLLAIQAAAWAWFAASREARRLI